MSKVGEPLFVFCRQEMPNNTQENYHFGVNQVVSRTLGGNFSRATITLVADKPNVLINALSLILLCFLWQTLLSFSLMIQVNQKCSIISYSGNWFTSSVSSYIKSSFELQKIKVSFIFSFKFLILVTLLGLQISIFKDMP